MSKDLSGARRLLIFGKIETLSPLHIGGGETGIHKGRPETDLPVQLGADGKPYIPATTLGGLLRGTAENLVACLEGWELEHLLDLFGAAREEGKGQRHLHPSRLFIRHARLVGDWEGITTRRDGVGIDRQRASARGKALYNYEVIPAGCKFDLHLELRGNCEKNRELLRLTLEVLQQLPSAVGGMGGRGLGRFKLHLQRVREIDLTQPDQFLVFVQQGNPFNPKKDAEPWDDWSKNHALPSVQLKADKHKPPAWRVPQVVTFRYRLKVEDPVLIRGQDSPESLLDDFEKRRNGRYKSGDTTDGIDHGWIGEGTDPSDRNSWRPMLPGASLRGVFRSHCERILRTLSWHYVGGDHREYKRRVAASDPLRQADEGYLRSSGFAMQDAVKDAWDERLRRNQNLDEEHRRHKASCEVADMVWDGSDPGERMWGSSQWRSRVMVSEAHLADDWYDTWSEMLLQHVAINRFTGGAADQKLFNALAVSQAEFTGEISVFGDEPWMLGLIALLFKDLHDGLVRIGSGKTRGYGKVQGWLTKIEVKTIPGSQIAETCTEAQPTQGQPWQTWCCTAFQPGAFLDGAEAWVEKLLMQGVADLQEAVKGYERREFHGGASEEEANP